MKLHIHGVRFLSFAATPEQTEKIAYDLERAMLHRQDLVLELPDRTLLIPRSIFESHVVEISY